jgi:hypothetical protein
MLEFIQNPMFLLKFLNFAHAGGLTSATEPYQVAENGSYEGEISEKQEDKRLLMYKDIIAKTELTYADITATD